MPSPDSAWSLVIGVAVVILMNACSSFGVNLQALALRRGSGLAEVGNAEAEDDDEDLDVDAEDAGLLDGRRETPARGWIAWIEAYLWHIGFICYIIPQLFGSIIALNFISPILLAPLGSSGLLFNVFFSSLLIGTKVGIWDWIATGLIVAGGCVVSLFGNVDVVIEGFDTLLGTLKSPLFIIYFTAVNLTLFTCFGVALALDVRKAKMLSVVLGDDDEIEGQTDQFRQEEDGVLEEQNRAEGAMGGLSHPGSLVVNGRVASATKFDNHIGFLFASAGGISASMTLTLVKCGLNLLGMEGERTTQEVIISVALFVSLAISVVLQLVTLNKAIVFISPLIAIPVFYTFFTTLSVSNTLVVVFSIPDLVLPPEIGFTIKMAVLGVSVIVGGVWVLSYSSFVGDKSDDVG
ncbi:hypothetical protein BC830DRAFT_1145506 [Chytriomyces sp. MP71]|nr:hypothetical protein BC830DRAFT_1145506 [Chytriomyces sp. MP71]